MAVSRTLALVLGAALAMSPALAQKRVSADVQVKQVSQGKVTTITKSVCCENNGRLVVHFKTPENYYVLTNTLGETKIYIPSRNEVITDETHSLSAKDELLYIFMTGRAEDLGLAQYGYSLTDSSRDGKYLVKNFGTNISGSAPKIRIAYENYLPICCEYYDKSDKVTSRTYLSSYASFPRLLLPCRVTNISYTKNNDSTVVRTIYSNVKVDSDDPDFQFEIPADAKAPTLPKK